MKSEKEIRSIINEIEEHNLCDKEYGDMKKFPFYGEINTNLATSIGIRKVLKWVIDEETKRSIKKDKVDY